MSAGRRVVQVNPRNTSQMCSGCGGVVEKELSVRVHACRGCGLTLDRDHNAARNILALGLQTLSATADRSRVPLGRGVVTP
jgi:putative transposase